MRFRAALAVPVLCLVAAPGYCDAAVARDGQVVMGTVLTVTVVAEDREAAKRLAHDAIEEARRWDDALTIWRRDGELARLNARAGQGPVVVSARLERGLRAMLELSGRTGGAFEPAVAMLPDPGDAHAVLRGVRDSLTIRRRAVNAGSGVVDTGVGQATASAGTAAATDASENAATASLETGSSLDPGGIGKGLALDAIVSLLTAGGVEAAFLDFGGSSQTAIGAPPGDARGWSVVVSGFAAGRTHGAVLLKDASLSTSRSGAPDTKPILDPRTKLPVPGKRLATVLAASATAADAWSTALVVLGRDGADPAGSARIGFLLEDAEKVSISPGFPLVAPNAPHGLRVENESQVLHDRSAGKAGGTE